MSKIKLDTTKLDQLLASIPGDVDEVVGKAAMLIEQQARLQVNSWPRAKMYVRTGALANGIMAERIKRGFWSVHDSVEYGVFWELGHHNIFLRRYVRRPFFTPAIMYVGSKFAQILAQGLFNE
jgi:hypothetical protein